MLWFKTIEKELDKIESEDYLHPEEDIDEKYEKFVSVVSENCKKLYTLGRRLKLEAKKADGKLDIF